MVKIINHGQNKRVKYTVFHCFPPTISRCTPTPVLSKNLISPISANFQDPVLPFIGYIYNIYI